MAQEYTAFSALGASLSIGSTGAEIELATPLHQKLMLRTGLSVLSLNFTKNMSAHTINGEDIPDGVDMDVKARMFNGKILVDYFPTSSAFFITGGVYAGKKNVVDLEGLSEYDLLWDDYILPSENGCVKAQVRTNSIKPYLGIGFGNAIPANRVGFRVELGAMYNGTPGIYNIHDQKLHNIHVDDSDISHTISKFKVYPVVSFRLTGRIF